VHVALLPLLERMMIFTVPALIAVTFPVLLTVATALFWLLHVILFVWFAGFTVAFNWNVSFAFIFLVFALSVIDVTFTVFADAVTDAVTPNVLINVSESKIIVTILFIVFVMVVYLFPLISFLIFLSEFFLFLVALASLTYLYHL